MRNMEPPIGLGSATYWRLMVRNRGPKSAMNSSIGSRTADWYRPLFSRNHCRLLLTCSSRRKAKSDGRKYCFALIHNLRSARALESPSAKRSAIMTAVRWVGARGGAWNDRSAADQQIFHAEDVTLVIYHGA